METWKDIPGYEESYMVSDMGRVYSKTRFIKQGDKRRLTKGRILSQKNRKYGYREVNLYKNNTGSSCAVHHLVCSAFIDEDITGMDVNHKDGNTSNNALYNLEVCTHLENMRHAIKTGLLKNYGEHSASSKLKDEDIIEIRSLRNKGYKLKDIANLFDISFQHVSDIANNKKWKHIN